MAEGGLKGSRSAEGLHRTEKPGKLSSDLLNKFRSDPALTCSHPLPEGYSLPIAHSFTSSSEEISTLQEDIKSVKTSVRIKVPDNNKDHLLPSSGDDDILSDGETSSTKDKKKRKSRWKWSPLKKMKKIFRRKKSPTRVKSCEEIQTEHYKATYTVSSPEDDVSLRNRTKSEPSLLEAKTKSQLAVVELHERRSTFDNPIQTMQSKPMNRPSGKLVKTLETDSKSQESTSEEPFISSDDIANQSDFTGLDWSIKSSDNGTEGAVSFENLPSASSLEGLQAAHDRIKVAPKHRRPPSRALSHRSSKNMRGNPFKPHRRSKTDPQEISSNSSSATESIEGKGIRKNSDVINTTISEDGEIKNDPVGDEVVADLKADATEIFEKVLKSSTVNKKKEESNVISAGDMSEDIMKAKTAMGSIKASSKTPEDNEDKSLTMTEKDTAIQSVENVKMEKIESKPREEVLPNKEISKPFLDRGRRSKSLNKNFEKTEPSEESPVKSTLQRGFSLDSIKKNDEKSPDLKLGKQGKNGKQDKPLGEQSKSFAVKNSSQECQAHKVESLVSVPASLVKVSDADKVRHENEKASNQPAWIALANRRSKRFSQLLNETNENQVSLEMKNDSPSAVIVQSNNQGNTSDSSDKRKPKIPAKPERLTNKTNSNNVTKETERRKVLNQSPSGGRDLSKDKCVVCGRTVFQMEKCNFDSSVLHRQCIKCSVCKRLLTIGNFIIAESKVYCKPHGQVVSVSL